jgi:cytochrome c556
VTRSVKKTCTSLLALAAGIGLTAAVAVAATATEAIKARQEAMESVGDAMKALGAIAKGEAPFDAAVVKKNAATIAEHLKVAEPQFIPGSDKGDVETWAKPEIWSDPAMFGETMKKAQDAAEALQGVTEEAAYRPALGQLGQNCKNCHDMYRRPKH